jgi:prepilin-type N-terminal cleavage/methylation domain-containing protein
MRYTLHSIKKGGFTLIETVLALAIFGMIVVVMGAFARDVFFFNDVLQTGITNTGEARKVLRPFTSEVRRAQASNRGAYAIHEAATSSFSFYTDTDSDGVRERVRYFLDGDSFKKGIITPSGSPLEYTEDDERIIKVIRDVVSTSSIFSYYDTDYYGSTSPALAHPVTLSDIRLVKIDLTVDANPNRAPSLLTITTQATLRNLKDNHDAQ